MPQEAAQMDPITDLELTIENLPPDQTLDAWKRLNIIAEAFMHDGMHATIARTTYAPATQEDSE